jgi:hypothetical protein
VALVQMLQQRKAEQLAGLRQFTFRSHKSLDKICKKVKPNIS